MKRSTNRILTSHTGVLNLPRLLNGTARPPREARDRSQIQAEVNEAIRLQIETGIDVVNDGQLAAEGAGNLMILFGGLLNGIEPRKLAPGETMVRTREIDELTEFYSPGSTAPTLTTRPVCVGPISLKDPESIHRELAVFKAGLDVNPGWEEAFYAVVSPSWMHEVIANEHYATDEEFLHAMADAMKPVYKAVVDAGYLIHIDAPDIAYDWELESYKNPSLTLYEYRKLKARHVEVDNYALEGIPEEKIRMHMCWGSWSAPHMYSVPLKEIAALILQFKAQCLSIEAAKPNHTHEWRVWEEMKIPDGKILMPGVVDHTTDVKEHPEVVAERIVQYARIVGRENVIAGTDCGMRGNAQRDWVKYRSIAEGAALATKELWRR